MHLPLRPVPLPELTEWLISQGNPEKLAQTAASLSRGAPGKAFALAENEASVLRPLQTILSSLPNGNAQAEHRIADMLATPKSAAARQLFWDCLIDIVYHQSRYAGTGMWADDFTGSAFGPLKLDRPKTFWLNLWDSLQSMQRAEARLNMDKKTVMLSALAALRAA